MKPLNTACFGAGGYAKVHLKELYRLAEKGIIRLQAAVVINPAEIEQEKENFERFGVKVCVSGEELYREFPELDLVCLPTGIASHESLTVEALKHGCNVLVEKPISGSLESARRMLEARDRSGKKLFVGFQHIYDPLTAELKRDLLSGRYGKIFRIAVAGLWPRGEVYYQRNGWAGRIRGADGTLILDSPLNNAFAHYLNLPLFLCGKTFETSAEPISVKGWTKRARNIENFDSCALKFKTDSETEILYLVSHTILEPCGPLIRIECEKAVIALNETDWEISYRTGEKETGELRTNLAEFEFDAVIGHLLGKETFTCSPEIAISHLKAVEMTFRNIQTEEIPEEKILRTPDGILIVKDMAERFLQSFRDFTIPQL